MIGKRTWVISDGFMHCTKNGKFESHEAVCVLNLSGEEAKINITIYFEDRAPLKNFRAQCENECTKHIRLDRIINDKGERVPYDCPYAILVESNVPIVVQHSRMDVSQPAMTLMTTIAY